MSIILHEAHQKLEILQSTNAVPDSAHKGSLYTLFLHSPLSAFCFVTNIVDIPIHLWDKCLAYVDRFMTEASRLITRCRGVGESSPSPNILSVRCWFVSRVEDLDGQHE